MAQVVVKLRPGGAEDARTDLLRTAAELGIDLTPVDPTGTDPSLAATFVGDAPDPEQAERAAAALRQHDAVEGAYFKPPDAPP